MFVTVNKAAEEIGFEYQTYGGQEYFQLDGTFSGAVSGGVAVFNVSAGYSMAAPIVPFNGNVYDALQAILAASGVPATAALPSPLNAISSGGGALISKVDCYAGS